MNTKSGPDLIHDWNIIGERPAYPTEILVTDETLRDGLQSPSITHPNIQDKVFLLYLMQDLGIDAADLGLCCAGERFKNDVVVLSREIANQNMPIQPQSAARTAIEDIEPIVDESVVFDGARIIDFKPIVDIALVVADESVVVDVTHVVDVAIFEGSNMTR